PMLLRLIGTPALAKRMATDTKFREETYKTFRALKPDDQVSVLYELDLALVNEVNRLRSEAESLVFAGRPKQAKRKRRESEAMLEDETNYIQIYVHNHNTRKELRNNEKTNLGWVKYDKTTEAKSTMLVEPPVRDGVLRKDINERKLINA